MTNQHFLKFKYIVQTPIHTFFTDSIYTFYSNTFFIHKTTLHKLCTMWYNICMLITIKSILCFPYINLTLYKLAEILLIQTIWVCLFFCSFTKTCLINVLLTSCCFTAILSKFIVFFVWMQIKDQK